MVKTFFATQIEALEYCSSMSAQSFGLYLLSNWSSFAYQTKWSLTECFIIYWKKYTHSWYD